MKTLALLVAVVFWAVPVQAQRWAPGALLDREDLDTDGRLFASASGAWGITASVKGVKNAAGVQTSYIAGGIAGGDPGRYPGAWFLGDSPSSRYYPSTLMPPFAHGSVLHQKGVSPATGIFVKALLYQPDQVKRITTASGSKLLLKQKGSVAFRTGNWSNDTPSTVSSFQAPACRAQANFSRKNKDGANLYRFKVTCGSQGSPEQQVRDALAGVFGENRNGFSVVRAATRKKASR